MTCEGIGETQKDGKTVFFCTALPVEERVYVGSKNLVTCSVEQLLRCQAANGIDLFHEISDDNLQTGKQKDPFSRRHPK